MIDAAPRAADLLVVGHHRSRRLVVHDKGEIGLVIAHAQRARGTDRLDLVGQQSILGRDAVGGVLVAAVGQRADPARVEERRHLIGVALGERVDDPGAIELRQVLGQPRQPLGGSRKVDDLQPQARPRQRPAIGAERSGVPRGQLLGDVGDDAIVGRGRGPEHGHARRQQRQHVAHAPVVRTEVVAPIGDAVGLIDDQQAHRGGEQGEHLVAEPGVVEPFGADQQQVDAALRQQFPDGAPLLPVGAVDGVGAQSEPLRRRDLVAHEREQWADDERGPGAGVAQQRRGHEVHRRLAPARALHAQHPRAVVDHVMDRLELPGAKRRVRIGGQRPQPLERRGGQGVGVNGSHLSILAGRPAGPAGARRQPPPCLPVTAFTEAAGGGTIAEIVTTLPSARRRRQRSMNEARPGRRGILRT